MKTALLFSDGVLDTTIAKTAHGLIFGPSRYRNVGVIDHRFAGKDAGQVVFKQDKQIPIFSDVQQALQQLNFKPDYGVIGVAPVGGKLTPSLIQTIKSAIEQEISIVSGLHTLLCEQLEINSLAEKHQVELIDIRKPRKSSELHMWSGKIADVTTPRVAVLGTDCAIGKRTTTGMLLDLCKQHQIKAEMIFTGQTGWLQGMHYGFIFDSTLNDFVAGELEHAILNCVNEANPQIIFIEGQSALRNPSGPCGSESICSAGAKYVILQHSPGQKYFICDSEKRYPLPSVESEIELIKYYGAEVLAITLNSSGLKPEELPQIKQQLSTKTKIPVVFPREEGLDSLLPILKHLVE